MDDRKMIETLVISPTKQREWTWPAVANFTLGGAGAGFYLMCFLNMFFSREMSVITQPVSFGLLAPVLMGLGFVFLTAEAGRPSRGRYLLCRFQSAWISRETLSFCFFALAVILDRFFPHLIFKALAGLSALFFIVAQGFILYSSRAVPTWNVPIIPFFFITSGFSSGVGVVLILAASGNLFMGNGFVLLSLICAIINLGIWFFYMRWPDADDFQSATKVLRRPSRTFFTIVFGHAISILILFLFQIRPYIGMKHPFQSILLAISGFAVIIAVAAQKAGIVLSSGFTGKISLRS
jgi:formate-dependent nitrite reductase membrane component NrfD